jgi:hypothetical protein
MVHADLRSWPGSIHAELGHHSLTHIRQLQLFNTVAYRSRLFHADILVGTMFQISQLAARKLSVVDV